MKTTEHTQRNTKEYKWIQRNTNTSIHTKDNKRIQTNITNENTQKNHKKYKGIQRHTHECKQRETKGYKQQKTNWVHSKEYKGRQTECKQRNTHNAKQMDTNT